MSLQPKGSCLAPNAEQRFVFLKQPSGAKHHVAVSADQFPLHLASELVFVKNDKRLQEAEIMSS